ncbi:hypothetical protein BOX15_Mlig020117g1 [Macrostomum lignano]|uniref:Uncharacterized protein n=1 Tax=Macrostomum lignano TaxID=282301 RepID=A0A267F2F5_9PLAT|nr:hypothetical protein BOX15_Mlig020117g1 [Macrostomum lignano]
MNCLPIAELVLHSTLICVSTVCLCIESQLNEIFDGLNSEYSRYLGYICPVVVTLLSLHSLTVLIFKNCCERSFAESAERSRGCSWCALMQLLAWLACAAGFLAMTVLITIGLPHIQGVASSASSTTVSDCPGINLAIRLWRFQAAVAGVAAGECLALFGLRIAGLVAAPRPREEDGVIFQETWSFKPGAAKKQIPV